MNIDFLTQGFIRNALLGGLMIAVVFGITSFFVVMRRLSFLTVGIAHAAFGGVAVGLLLGLSPYVTSIVFCLLIGFLIRYQSKESSGGGYDAVTGILFAATMALGIVLLALKKDYTFDIMGYLFGSILGITPGDLLIMLLTGSAVLLYLGFFFRQLLFVTFDPEVARSSGIRVSVLESSIVVIVALLVVIAIKMIGIILVTAFLVLPASFATKLCSRYQRVILVSLVFSVVVFLVGFFLSYQLDLPAGAGIVLLGTVVFLATPNSIR